MMAQPRLSNAVRTPKREPLKFEFGGLNLQRERQRERHRETERDREKQRDRQRRREKEGEVGNGEMKLGCYLVHVCN